jgi:hypothetical protein
MGVEKLNGSTNNQFTFPEIFTADGSQSLSLASSDLC